MPSYFLLITLSFVIACLAFYLGYLWAQRRQKSAYSVEYEERERLQETLRVFSLYIENSPLAVIEWDNNFRIKQWSKRAEEMFGWEAVEVLGKLPQEIGYIHEDDMNQVTHVVDNLTSGRQSRSINRNRNYKKDGTLLYCEWYESVLFDEWGQLASIWSLIHDVTEQERAETELRQLNDGLEQRVASRTADLMVANQELQTFAYSVSHDLRTPLRAIDGFSKFLLEDYHDQLDKQGRRYLQRIRAGSQRMGHLIDDLLALSRVARQEMAQQSVNLTNLATEIVEELHYVYPDDAVNVQIAADMQAVGDRSLLRLVLQNLLDNAWKFSSMMASPQIEFGTVISNEEHVYFVHDNGIGFDMAYVNKIFGPFQRLHLQEAFSGNGIGLATVQRIVQRHNGRIWAESSEQQGANFLLHLGMSTKSKSILTGKHARNDMLLFIYIRLRQDIAAQSSSEG